MKTTLLLGLSLSLCLATGLVFENTSQAGWHRMFGIKKDQASIDRAIKDFHAKANSGSHTPAQIRAAAARVEDHVARRSNNVSMPHVMRGQAHVIHALNRNGHHDIAKEQEGHLILKEKALQPTVRRGVAEHQSGHVLKVEQQKQRDNEQAAALVRQYSTQPAPKSPFQINMERRLEQLRKPY